MNRKIILVLSCVLVAVGALAQKSTVIDGVVWVVGDNAILRSDIEEARIGAQYDGSKIEGDPYCVLPERIAIQKLFLHQAKIDSFTVATAQVEQQVEAQINYYLREIGSKEKVEEYFKKSLREIRELLVQNVSEQSLAEQVKQSIVQDIAVTPSEVRRYYNKTNQDSLPMVANQVEVQILTLEPEIPYSELEDTKNRLREFARKVNEGESDFSILARLYSDDLESAKNGGELGFVGRGTLVPEFASAAFALTEPGKVSRVVQTEYGYHIIQLLEKKDEKINCRHILLRPRVSPDLKVTTLEKLDSIAKVVRDNKLPFEAAVGLYSSDKKTRMNEGIMANDASGSSRFELQNLPPEVSKQVSKMNVGEISEPFMVYSRELGKEVFAIVKLKTKVDSHRANLSDDYQLIKSMCENEKKTMAVEAWIKNKIKDTYITIAPEWRDCDYKYDFWLK